MSPKRTRTTYQSASADNVRPGGPTTMDVLMRWLMIPGNVKRWRMDPRAPLIREVVDAMQEEGLAHRQPPFVRYKLIAIEKQYITAQKWLLETGMHDAYMTGKAAKEVRLHVDHLCPHFRELDPAFRCVPFSKKHAETIELDEESAEDAESELMHEMEMDSEEERVRAEKTAVEKRNTFRDRLFANKVKVSTMKPRQKKVSRLAKQIAPSPGYAAAKKSLTTAELQTINASKEHVSAGVVDSVAKNKTSVTTVQSKKSLLKEHTESSALAMEQAVPTLTKSATAFAKKRVGRPSVNSVLSTTLNASGIGNGTTKAALTVQVAQRKTTDGSTTTVRSREADENDGNKIERNALLKRVNDEEKQRQEVYSLERAKLAIELEAKQVQLLFEKAAARQRLDQLGVPQKEIDRILPL